MSEQARQVRDYASRKFVISILGLITASVLVWFGKIDGGNWSFVVSTVVGLYTMSNAAVKFAERPR